MTVVAILPHDQAVLGALGTIGNPVGYAEAPDGALAALLAEPPGPDYVILYPISGLRAAASIADADGEIELVYQTTIVARLPEGARWLIDQIESALVGLAIYGRTVVRVRPYGVGDVRPDRPDELKPTVFYATPRWHLWTIPA